MWVDELLAGLGAEEACAACDGYAFDLGHSGLPRRAGVAKGAGGVLMCPAAWEYRG